MIIKTFVKGPIQDNNYLLIDEESKEAVLIDCTEPADDIIDTVNEYGAKLKYILITHGHFDHVLGINYFREKTGAKALIHEADEPALKSMNLFMQRFNMPPVDIQQVDKTLKDNDIIEFGENKIKVIYTPGHTKGGVCYLLQDKLFSGDTIFYESIGRTDLDGGSYTELQKSIEEKIFTLPENITIYPGHGKTTSVNHEKDNNQEL